MYYYIRLFIITIMFASLQILTECDDNEDVINNEEIPKILVNNPNIPEIAFEIMQKCNVIVANHTKEDVLEKIVGVDGLFWVPSLRLDNEILDKAGPKLKAIGIMAAGIDSIDIQELNKRGIKAGNTPIVLDDAVADVAIMLALGAARRLTEGRWKIEKNEWTGGVQWMLGQDIVGSTVGIVGLGGIGQTIAKRLAGFNVGRIVYSGHKEKPEAHALNAEFVDFLTLVSVSDFIFISCPLTEETRNMFNATVFEHMKNTSILINIARGAIVNQIDLIDALKNKKIFAAGLDVMTPEPLPTDSELLKLPNVVLLPHLGSATLNTRTAMADLAAKNLMMGVGGEPMFTPIN